MEHRNSIRHAQVAHNFRAASLHRETKAGCRIAFEPIGFIQNPRTELLKALPATPQRPLEGCRLDDTPPEALLRYLELNTSGERPID
jgi:hypothetical protein